MAKCRGDRGKTGSVRYWRILLLRLMSALRLELVRFVDCMRNLNLWASGGACETEEEETLSPKVCLQLRVAGF